jgi:hypothetical protein
MAVQQIRQDRFETVDWASVPEPRLPDPAAEVVEKINILSIAR